MRLSSIGGGYMVTIGARWVALKGTCSESRTQLGQYNTCTLDSGLDQGLDSGLNDAVSTHHLWATELT